MLISERLILIPCQLIHFELIDNKDYEKLSSLLNVKLKEKWKQSLGHFNFFYERFKNDSSLFNWWIYFIILKSENTIIGSCGFKGKHNQYGEVEIGYEILEDYRNQGYATETAGSLIKFAFENHEIRKVKANTYSLDNASSHVLKNQNMVFISHYLHPDEGDLWQWAINR